MILFFDLYYVEQQCRSTNNNLLPKLISKLFQPRSTHGFSPWLLLFYFPPISPFPQSFFLIFLHSINPFSIFFNPSPIDFSIFISIFHPIFLSFLKGKEGGRRKRDLAQTSQSIDIPIFTQSYPSIFYPLKTVSPVLSNHSLNLLKMIDLTWRTHMIKYPSRFPNRCRGVVNEIITVFLKFFLP